MWGPSGFSAGGAGGLGRSGERHLHLVDGADGAGGELRRGAGELCVGGEADDGGEYTLSDFRNQIREQLAQERGMRRVIDQMVAPRRGTRR